MSRLSDLLARLLGQHQGRVRAPAGGPRPAGRAAVPRDAVRPSGRDSSPLAAELATTGEADSSSEDDETHSVQRERTTSSPEDEVEATSGLTLDRMEAMITDVMGYGVQRHAESGHPCLLGTWDTYPFVIEIPDGHEGWLLVSGDWEEPVGEGLRDELAASVNDWNRDKFFPTVSIIDSPAGPLVRATYLVDLSSSLVRPLLPEL